MTHVIALLALLLTVQEADDAPPAHDRLRFPPDAWLCASKNFATDYIAHLERRTWLNFGRREEYQAAINETRRLIEIYELLWWCPQEPGPDTRCRLKRLRDLIGEEMYYRGELPPCVPYWRFDKLP